MEGSGRHYRIEEEMVGMLRGWIREEIWFGSNGARALRRGLEDSALSEEVEKISRFVEGQSRRGIGLLDMFTSALLFLKIGQMPAEKGEKGLDDVDSESGRKEEGETK
jgi:hypothetical protein